ncbi:MAG: hypothetical protein R6U78_07230 [Bacteroidales bacterium]
METSELRKELHSYIEKADDRFLRMVHALIKEYEETAIVGYEVDGTPITKEDLRRQARDASARVEARDYITREDLE